MAEGGIVTVVVTANADGDPKATEFPSAVDALRAAAAEQRVARTRIGVHVGEAGTPEVVALALCDAAAPGQTLTSDLVRALVGTRGEFTFHDAGYLALKGLAEPVAAWEVAWERAPVGAMPMPAGLGIGERLPFVGRADLLAQLDEQWAKAVAGHRTLVMLAGEPGIGKTRLAAEFARRAHGEGALVLFGHADEETLLPYQPFVEALHQVVRSLPPAEVVALVGENGPELSRLLPSLREHVPGAEPPIRVDPDSERYRLFEAVIHMLSGLSQRGPLVLVLDDLHWADKPSLLLLHHLFRTQVEMGLLVIVTYRDTDLDRRHPLSETLADLRRLLQFERLNVTGWSEDDMQRYLAKLSGREPPFPLVPMLREQTEGNPFYVGEVLRNLVESGAVENVDGEWVTTAAIDDMSIPEGVREVVGRRLSRLSEDANVALGVGAIAGRDFELDVIAPVTEMEQERLLDALEEAVAARLISEVVGYPVRFHFTHALVRETLYNELSTARRVRLHRRIAQSIEALYAADLDAHLAELSFHYSEAAQSVAVATAVDYARRAGQQALEQLAYEEATAHFDRALQSLDLSEGDERATRADMLVQRARGREASGDLQGAKTDYLAAAELARSLGDAYLLAQAALGWAGAFTTGAMNPEIVALLEAALDLLPEHDSVERCGVLCRLSFEIYWGGDHDRMRELATAGVEMARRIGDPSILGPGLQVAALLYDDISEAEVRLGMMQEAIEAADLLRDGASAHLARSFASWAQLELGDRAGYERTAAEGTAKAIEMRLPRMRWYVPLWETVLALLAGDIAEAERLAFETLQLGQAADDFASLQIFGAQMFSIRREQGRLEEFEGLVRGMVDDFPAVPAWRAGLAVVLAELGKHDDARSVLHELCGEGLAGIPRDNAWSASVSLVGDAAFLVDDAVHAAAVLDALAPHVDRFVAVGQAECFGSVARHLGQAAATCGRYDEAVGYFERGIAADTGMGAIRMVLRGRWGLARTLLRRDGPGDRQRARELVAESVPLAERLGLTSLAGRLGALTL